MQVIPGVYALDVRPLGIESFLSPYVVVGREAAVIDPGPSCSIPALIRGLEALGVQPSSLRYVLATHIHIDHVGGAALLLEWAREAELIVHPRGVKHMANPARLWESTKAVLGELAELYGEIRPVEEDRILAAKDGDEIEVAGVLTLQVVETPGHASHHLSFFDQEKHILFTGDSAGVYIAPLDLLLPTTPPPFRLDLALASLDKQIALGPEIACYTHFGFADQAVQKLEAHKRQLKFWAKVIAELLNEPVERVLEALLAEDPNLAGRAKEISEHPILTSALVRSIMGMRRFLKAGGEVP